MLPYMKLDEDGYPIETVLFEKTDEIPSDCKLGWSSDQKFFQPKYDFTLDKWIETKTDSEILDELKIEKIELLVWYAWEPLFRLLM